MRCNKCGKILDDNTKFCNGCGNKVEQVISTSNNSTPKKNNIIPIVFLVMFAISVAVVAGFFTKQYFAKNNKDKPKVEQVKDPEIEQAPKEIAENTKQPEQTAIVANTISNQTSEQIQKKPWQEMFTNKLLEYIDREKEDPDMKNWSSYSVYNDDNFALLYIPQKLVSTVYAFNHNTQNLYEVIVATERANKQLYIFPSDKSFLVMRGDEDSMQKSEGYSEKYVVANSNGFTEVFGLEDFGTPIVFENKQQTNTSLDNYINKRKILETKTAVSAVNCQNVQQAIEVVTNWSVNPVYESARVLPIPKSVDLSQFIFPRSNTEILLDYELRSKTKEELRVGRNEIYARHGRMFNDQSLQSYFNSKSWYKATIGADAFNENILSEIEKKNLQLITDAENAFSKPVNTPQKPVASYGDYIFPDSNVRELTSYELYYSSTKEELRIARNEIYARHGRLFSAEDLQTYFDSKWWYSGSIKPEDFNENVLNKYEKKNLQLITDAEKN